MKQLLGGLVLGIVLTAMGLVLYDIRTNYVSRIEVRDALTERDQVLEQLLKGVDSHAKTPSPPTPSRH